jgi:hypothetical protein
VEKMNIRKIHLAPCQSLKNEVELWRVSPPKKRSRSSSGFFVARIRAGIFIWRPNSSQRISLTQTGVHMDELSALLGLMTELAKFIVAVLTLIGLLKKRRKRK